MVSCPHCQSPDLEFDLASDHLIYLTFWVCSGCSRRGVLRMVDREPVANRVATLPPPQTRRMTRRSFPPLRHGRTKGRAGLSRA